MSHEIVNELITLMGQKVLRQLLEKIKGSTPARYAVIADETTDVAVNEQFNLSIRYVDDNYVVSEDHIGMLTLPNTTALTICCFKRRCALLLSFCRGQAYDGAAAMQGIRNGLATIMKRDASPAALSVHCLAHCLNLCLQDVTRVIKQLRDAIDIVREISKLINNSPKRKVLFLEKFIRK